MNKSIMKERLIELLNKKYDHFCDQCGVNKDSHYVENLAGYLLENGVIVPSCKAGDVLYRIVNDAKPHITKDCVSKIENNGAGWWITLLNDRYCSVDEIGKTLFLTSEEAEQALKGGAE